MNRRKIRKLLPSGKIILIPLFVLAGFIAVKLIVNTLSFARSNKITPGFITNLALGNYDTLKSHKGRINIVILGVAGGIHEGANLTDTIQFVSLSLEKDDSLMLSIPRDVWLPSLKQRVNVALRDGEEKKEGGGFILAKAGAEEVLGVPVQYAVVVDFSGFVTIIDFVGGIDVDVAQAFDDHFYPVPGKENDFCAGDPALSCRYESLRFDSGLQHMDGDKVLKLVRSRQSENNNEGSDFARGKRQQQVIVALADKIKKQNVWANPQKAQMLLNILQKAIKTDLTLAEEMLLTKRAYELKDKEIRRIAIDSLLINPPLWQYNGAWVLVPPTGDFKQIQEYVACHLENESCTFPR